MPPRHLAGTGHGMTRSLAELMAVDDPAWPRLTELMTNAHVQFRLHEGTVPRRQQTLHRLQVTARSTLGALALHCGGLEVDHGWVKVLGGGVEGLPDVAAANHLGPPTKERPAPAFLVVAYDVLGGVFAVDGGGLGFARGEVCYWGPDTLTWDGTGMGHSDVVATLLAGGFTAFYQDLRWPGWESEVEALTPGQGLSVYPPPSSVQGQEIGRCSRRPVPLLELLDLYGPAARA